MTRRGSAAHPRACDRLACAAAGDYAPMDARPRIGHRGERAAARHLSRRGWLIVASRWRGGGGELDIVAHRAGVVAVCEVKVRRAPLGAGDVPVSAAQRARIMAGAEAFLAAHPAFSHHTVHLDLVLVRPRPGAWRVEHLERALEW
jgi:putative endonuclease